MKKGHGPGSALSKERSDTTAGTRSSMWSVQAVDGDTTLEVPSGVEVKLDGRLGLVMEQSSEFSHSHVPVCWQDDGSVTNLKPRDLKRAELQSVTQNLDAHLRKLIVSKITETLPHELEFLTTESSELPEITFSLDRAYESADSLVVLHQPKPGAEGETLSDSMQLSPDGKRASVKIRSFCHLCVAGRTRQPTVLPHREPKPSTGADGDEELSATSSDEEASINSSDDEVDTADKSDAYFSAFAPPEVARGGRTFAVEVAAFALEYSVEVAETAVARGKEQKAAPRQRPLLITHGAEVSIELQLPDEFVADPAIKRVHWDGTYSTAVFKVTCVDAEAGPHFCEALIAVVGQSQNSISLQYDLHVVEAGRSLPASGVSSPESRELVETVSSTTHLPERRPGGEHHIFINYRRTYYQLADRVRLRLEKHGYRCFFDLDSDCGIGAGDFQSQLKGSLKGVPYLLAILTPAPSGPDKLETLDSGETVNRHELSYMQHVKRYGELEWNDWCAVELTDALADPWTEVIPLFHPDYAMEDYAGQLKEVPGLSPQNAKGIGGPGHFEKSILTVHELIQRDIAKKKRAAAQQKREGELVATLSSVSRDWRLRSTCLKAFLMRSWSRSRSRSHARTMSNVNV